MQVTFAEITRQEALKMGLLVNVSKIAKKHGFRITVAITDTALIKVEDDIDEVVHDAMHASMSTEHSQALFKSSCGVALKTVFTEYETKPPTLTICCRDEFQSTK